MSVRDELVECPTTYGLAASWVVIYLVMLISQEANAGPAAHGFGLGLLRPETIRLFGAITWRDFSGGEPWRAITATFVHVNVPHLVMNLIGLIQLGRLIEPWYGARQFLAICLGLGGAGNALGVLMRHGMATFRVWLQSRGLDRVLPAFLSEGAPGITENTPAAGGSTVILGLIGLGLVVGWRSRTRIGAFLRDQMVGFLVFTAVLGFVGRQFVDNYGHAGGAIAGACLGFLHRRLVWTAERGWTRRVIGLVAVLAIVACATLQANSARKEIAASHRALEIQKCLIQANDAEVLRERLALLEGLFEQTVNERFEFEAVKAQLGGDPEHVVGLDPSAFFELLGRGQTPVTIMNGPRPPVIALLEFRLKELADLRPRLDASLTGDDFDTILRVGTEALHGPVDPRATYLFRLARRTLAHEAEKLRDTWLSRRDELERLAR